MVDLVGWLVRLGGGRFYWVGWLVSLVFYLIACKNSELLRRTKCFEFLICNSWARVEL